MRKYLIIAALAAVPAFATPAGAQSNGTLGGAAVGGVAGAAVGGPVGAAVGAVGGAVVGNQISRGRVYRHRPVYRRYVRHGRVYYRRVR